MPSRRLILFLKAPRPGLVKTRLARALGREAALRAYRQLVEATLASVANCRAVELRFTPDSAVEEVSPWLRPGWTARPQGAGNLGQRLDRAFAEAFAGGADRVLGIGSDCPYLTAQDLEEAWNRLARHDAVFGPSRDGGYWLVGLARPQPAIFQGVRWSTTHVLAETLDRCRELGLSTGLLRELEDVDEPDAWMRYRARMRRRRAVSPE